MIPYSTDAPIYYNPYATVGLIVVNVVCFFAFCLNPVSKEDVTIRFTDRNGNQFTIEELEEQLSGQETEEELTEFMNKFRPNIDSTDIKSLLSLQFGKLRPWQWITNNFMHQDFVHLIGNMIFLWSFGLVVEGKIGAIRLLVLYFTIGTIYGFVLQIGSIVVGGEGSALGASAAIFGLLAFCMAWAPANEFEVFFMYGFYMSTFEISIVVFGAIFFIKETVFFIIQGLSMSSELLHILGFLVSFPIALWMVKTGRVDCEGWDFFSYMSGHTGRDSKVAVQHRRAQRARERAAEKRTIEKEQSNISKSPLSESPSLSQSKSVTSMRQQVDEAVANGDMDLAIKLQAKLFKNDPNCAWGQESLYRVIQFLVKQKRYRDVIPLAEEYERRFIDNRFAIQKLLLKILILEKRPKDVIMALKRVDTSNLSDGEIEKLKEIALSAKAMIQSGIRDIE